MLKRQIVIIIIIINLGMFDLYHSRHNAFFLHVLLSEKLNKFRKYKI